MLIAAQNPCPCGYYGDPAHACTCSNTMITPYQKGISGPLMDRIDIHIEVPRVPFEKLTMVQDGVSSPYGAKYVIDGPLVTIASPTVRVRTIWIVDAGETRLRFVTAYPT